jgi:hypothetical protein
VRYAPTAGERGRTVKLRGYAVFAIMAVLLAQPAQARDVKPPLPPGRDPGGLAVALLSGVDYTLPELAARLARDGEGELIGWDFADDDRRPFERRWPAAGASATSLALKIAGAGRRIIPVRIGEGARGLAQAVAFIARTPAKIAAVPMWANPTPDWPVFGEAAERAPQVLFVVAAGDDGRDLDADPAYRVDLDLPNALLVTAATTDGSMRLQQKSNWGARTVDVMAPASTSADAIAVVVAAAASVLAAEPTLDGAGLKRLLLERSARHSDGEATAKTKFRALLPPAAAPGHAADGK